MAEEKNIEATSLNFRKAFKDVKQSYLKRIRWAVGLFYFCMGLCFSTWVSRIPAIREAMGMSEADLGTLLFSIPFGQMFIMPFSGRLVNKYGSHKTVVLGLCLYATALIGLGFAQERWQLMLGLFFFGICSNLTNISVNTQGIYTEGLFHRAIMSSFHGAWSTAGFTGGLIGLGMLALKLPTYLHFIMFLNLHKVLKVIKLMKYLLSMYPTTSGIMWCCVILTAINLANRPFPNLIKP